MDHQLDLSSLPPPPPEFFLDNFDNDEEFIFSNSNCKDYNCTIKQGIDPGLTNAHGRTAKEVIARDTPFARELHQILYERISAVAAVATRDFCNLADPRSIAFRAGEHLTQRGRIANLGVATIGTARASLDSGRSSSHTATSSDTRSAVALTASGPSGPPAPPARTLQRARCRSGRRLRRDHVFASLEQRATNTPRSAAAPAAANGSVDSGLGPHRQSMVSTCSSGSLGSLPDDNSSAASVSSGELQYQQQQQHGWLREDWRSLTSSQQLHRFLDWCQLACYHRSIEEAGYDLATLVRCTPEDLNAPGVTNPRAQEAPAVRSGAAWPGHAGRPGARRPARPYEDAACLTADAALTELCCRLGLPDTASACLRRAGFQLVRDLGQMAWEDLEEIGINRLVIDRLRRPRHGPESDQNQPDQQQGTLRRQSAKSTVSCGTCTSSDSIAVQPDPFLAASAAAAPPQQSLLCWRCRRSSRHRLRSVGAAAATEAGDFGPPLLRRRRLRHAVRLAEHHAAPPGGPAPAYENAAALADSPAALARLGAAASAMPFANEDCGTIRHKPASASIAAAVASPQFGRGPPCSSSTGSTSTSCITSCSTCPPRQPLP
uniref:SAM domain-containing protein n=1 Tax=Macrostomum lignano TaxID=282301 RepID=A0A1I8HW74_9PLAT